MMMNAVRKERGGSRPPSKVTSSQTNSYVQTTHVDHFPGYSVAFYVPNFHNTRTMVKKDMLHTEFNVWYIFQIYPRI
jgi:hypothetical protein